MLNTKEKLGAFIVPTGVGASIGGYAGDASVYAKKFSQISKLIVNPNVVNAGGFSGITDNMFYVEGYSLDEFFKGNIQIKPSYSNKIGIVFDRAIPEEVLNIHINTLNAVKTVYGVEIAGYEITQNNVGVEFFVNESGISTGIVNNIETLNPAVKNLLSLGAEAVAIVCLFEDPENDDGAYANGSGVDPVGGVEGILSHYISKEFQIPCAHSPAFRDFSISTEIVNPKASSEYITPTFLPCVLLGLNNAPKLVKSGGISIDELDYLVIPFNSIGCVPVFECIKRGINIYAVQENKTVLNVTNEQLLQTDRIIQTRTYDECLDLITSSH